MYKIDLKLNLSSQVHTDVRPLLVISIHTEKAKEWSSRVGPINRPKIRGLNMEGAINKKTRKQKGNHSF